MMTLIFQNSSENVVRISALKFFVAFWGASWKLFGLPVGVFIYAITN
jgi:hypothetical protein